MLNDKIFQNFSKDDLRILKIYNIVKNNPEIKEIAEQLELYEKNGGSQAIIDYLKEVENDLKPSINSFNSFDTSISFIRKPSNQTKPIRIYMDGVFDIIHSGHFNAIRQAKKLGDVLVVGVNSDEEVAAAKGPTLLNGKERAILVSACKWVDEVVEDTPYSPSVQLLDELNVDYCAHGDDMPLNADGEDCFARIKEAGRMRIFKRTEGISTTEIIGRLLSATKVILPKVEEGDLHKTTTASEFSKPVDSKFLTTGKRMIDFCNNRTPKAGDRVVYIDGAFDILHVGHIDMLKKAKAAGDFLYVGVHDDKTVNTYRGENYPILQLQERVFNLLALKYVDDVIISAPWVISKDLILTFGINLVVSGSETKFDQFYVNNYNEDPYRVPKEMGIYKVFESSYEYNYEIIVKRLLDRREQYLTKYQKKSEKEKEYYETKEYIQEL